MMSSCQEDYKEVIVDGDDDEETRLPGFRFHPTDEELVRFYLKRKVQKKSISVEIIKQIDIYKHDPWELAKASSVGDKEWYFYCKRERKYRNSARPNRVTSSGFWKATGIDKPIYSNGGEGHQCVGLKKSLVYYQGSAGKGTKTEWMMHEFRLPSEQQHSPGVNPRDTLQEAEVWTLCRIFKRNRKYAPDWREISSKRPTMITNNTITSSKTCSSESTNEHECYINFGNMKTHQQHIPESYSIADCRNTEFARQSCREQYDTKSMVAGPSMAHMSASDASIFSSPLKPSSSVDDQAGQFIAAYDGNWDDLSSVVEFATRPPLL